MKAGDTSLSDTGLLTVVEAAKWLSVGRTSVYQLMDSGRLPYIRVLTQRRIDIADLKAYVEAQRAHSAPALRSVR